MIKAIFFDLSETLIWFDDEGGKNNKAKKAMLDFLCHQINYSMEALEVKYDETRKRFEANSMIFSRTQVVRETLKDLMRKNSDSRKLARETVNIYEFNRVNEIVPYRDVRLVLERLKFENYRVAVITNSNNELFRIKRRLRYLNLLKFFDVVVNSQSIGKRKPDSALPLAALEKINKNRSLSIKPDEVLYVDNRWKGIKAGKDAGMIAVRIIRRGDPYMDEEDLLFEKNPIADYVINEMINGGLDRIFGIIEICNHPIG